MKFTCNNSIYQASQNNGVYPDAYIVDLEKRIESNNSLVILFSMYFIIDEISKKSNYETYLQFNHLHKDMFIKPDKEGDDPIELTEFLSKGGVYSKEKVHDWGYPSVKAVKQYFLKDSIWDKLEFADTPFKQIAIDWVEHNLKIDNLPIVENFSYKE